MSLEPVLRRLAENTAPPAGLRRNAKNALMKRIRSDALLSAVDAVQPSTETAENLRNRILRVIRPASARTLQSLGQTTTVPVGAFARIRENVLERLQAPVHTPLVHSGIKWGAAFAVFLLIIRSMPLILLAPPTNAETTVQLLPAGDQVSIFIGGVWRNVTGPEVLKGPAMITTGNARATVVLNDDGVFRLAPNTTLKIQDVSDHPQASAQGITATLVHGQVWALGLLPPITEGLQLETPEGILSLNAGSASVSENDGTITVAVYDKGVTFNNSPEPLFLVSGERITARDGHASSIVSMPTKAYADVWVSENLSQDAVHRAEIAKLQETRRAELAGILPTSIFYPAKRIAEEVDVFFTLTHDGRTEKRIEQANTRLSEALALIKEGEADKATTPLGEYSQSLVALASDDQDNLVKELIRKQIAEASATITTPSADPQTSVGMLTAAVTEIGAAIPDSNLSPKDIQGYVLVDKLAEINKILSLDHDPAAAAAAYAEVRPYLSDLLAQDTGTHPLLQKEAKALLVSTSSLLKVAEVQGSDAKIVAAMTGDVAKYLPEEQESIEELNAKLDAQVQVIRGLIIKFDSPVSRYNELMHQMDVIVSDTSNPNRGLLLRKLKAALPVALGEYVNLGIKRLGDELN